MLARTLFKLFSQVPSTEYFLKGILVSFVDNGENKFAVVNIHTTAGGFRGPEYGACEVIRAKQFTELEALLETIAINYVVLGDFNAGPEASVEVTDCDPLSDHSLAW